MSKLIVSYSRKDSVVARKLIDTFKKNEFDVWVDWAAEHRLECNDAMLRIQEQHAEDLVLQHTQLQAQMILHRLWG